MADVSWGGFGADNFVNSSQVGGGLGGRTFIDGIVTDRLLQNGAITSVKYRNTSAGLTPNGMKFKVFRPNGSNWDFVGESEKFTPVTGSTQTRTLSTPITGVRPGDTIGVWLDIDPGTGVDLSVAASAGNHIHWIPGDEIGTNVTFPNDVNDFALDLEAFGVSPYLGLTGDSIEAGHGENYNSFFDETGPAGDISAELGYNGFILDDRATYQDFSKGSQTWAWVVSTGLPAILTNAGTHGSSSGIDPTAIGINCGINDVATDRLWADVEADLDSVYALAGSIPLFINNIIPDTNLDDTHAELVRTFNANYLTWAAGKPTVTIVEQWASMGQLRASTGFNDDLKASYDSGDGVHPNAAGAAVMAQNRITALFPVVIIPPGAITEYGANVATGISHA